MRIALLAPLVAPMREAQLGGAHAFVGDLARALRAAGDHVAVVCAAGSELKGVQLLQVDVPPEVAAARVVPSGGDLRRSAGALRTFRTAFASAADWGAEVISQHAFDVEAFEVASQCGRPVAHTLHLLPSTSDAVAVAVRNSADSMVSVSSWSRAAWHVAGVETRTILNGIPRFAPRAGAVRQVAIVAGRVSPEKGTHRAIAMARAAGLEPLVFGEVYDAAYAARHGIVSRAIARDRLWDEMATATVTLMPVEWDEPFGMVAAEAMMAGCPVVAYARGALPALVDRMSGVLVEPGDEAAFISAIDSAAKLNRRRVRSHALREFLIDRCAREYRALFARLLSGRPGPG